jgi:hypothetical protein
LEFAAICGKFRETCERTDRFLNKSNIFNFLFVKEEQYVADMAEEAVRDFMPFDTKDAADYHVDENPVQSAAFVIDSGIYFEAA